MKLQWPPRCRPFHVAFHVFLEPALKVVRLPKRKKPRPTEVRRVRHRRLKFPPLISSRAKARAALHREAKQHAKTP